jgi:hypothetical protein
VFTASGVFALSSNDANEIDQRLKSAGEVHRLSHSAASTLTRGKGIQAVYSD